MRNFLRLTLAAFLTVITSLSANKANATHYAGGDFNWVCLGGDTFLITYNLFRDCSGATVDPTYNIEISSSCTTYTHVLPNINPGGDEVSQLCDEEVNCSECVTPQPPASVCPTIWPGMQHYIYQDTIVLPSAPGCGTYTIYWEESNRNPSQNLVNSSAEEMHVQTNVVPSSTDCNNSPSFTAQPIPYVCANQLVNYNYGITELDGDSLVYSFATPLGTGGNPLTFQGGFSAAVPIPGITINPQNGQISFVAPNYTGSDPNYVVVVQVDEYDPVTGAYKGSVFRDIQFVVIQCPNTPPVLSAPGISNFTSQLGTGTLLDSNTIQACMGDQISWSLQFTDVDTIDTLDIETNIFDVLDSNELTMNIVQGNPLTVNFTYTPNGNNSGFESYYIAIKDDACPVFGLNTYAFNMSVITGVYAGPDQLICNTDTAYVNVSGDSLFTWTVIGGDPNNSASVGDPISVGNNISCDTCKDVWLSPSVTTTYLVHSAVGGGLCPTMDTITIFIVPNFDLNLPPDTTICFTSTYQIDIDVIPALNASYQWSNGNTLNFDTIQDPTADPDENTTYSVTVTSDQGCVRTGETTVNITPAFPSTLEIFGDTLLCNGDTSQLVIDALNLVQPCGPASSLCVGNAVDYTLGTGVATNTGTSFPCPYGNWYWGAKHQILLTAAELTGMGLAQGSKISSLAFDVGTVGATSNFQNYSIKMGCTSQSDMSSWYTGPLVQVVNPYVHTVSTGWNVHQFDVAYIWDGLSNLVFEVCFNNSAFATNGNSQVKYTTTSFTSVIFYRADNANVCPSTLNSGTSSNRPNIRLGACGGFDPSGYNFQWLSGASTLNNQNIFNPLATPTAPTQYQVVVSDTFANGCSDTLGHFINVVNEFNSGFNSPKDPFCITDDADTLNAILPDGYWSGIGIIDTVNGIFDPSLAGVGAIPVTYNLTGNCASDSTVSVNVIALPDVTIDAPTEYCFDAPPITLSAATSGGVWSGSGMIDTIAGTFKPNLPSGQTATIYYELDQPCFNTDTFEIFIRGKIGFTPKDTTVCNNEVISLSNNYSITPGNHLGNGPIKKKYTGAGITNQDNGVFDANNVTHGINYVSLTISDTFGYCANTDTISINVFKVDYAKLADSKFCDNEKGANIKFDLPGINDKNTSFSNIAAGANPNNDTIFWLYDGSVFRFNPKTAGEGKWGLQITHTTSNGCVGKSIDTITVLKAPGTPLPIDSEVCEGTPYSLLATGGNNDSLYWASTTSNSSADFLGYGSPVKQGDAPDAASGNIVAYVKEVNDICQSKYQKVIIPVRPSPKTNYYRDYLDTLGVQQNVVDLAGEDLQGKVSGVSPFRVVFSAENVVLEDLNLGKKEDSLIWVVYGLDLLADTVLIDTVSDQGTTTPELQVIEYLFNEPTYAIGVRRARPYIMELTHYNEYGCFRKVSSLIDVKGVEQIPNVFTPNGDGINDFFVVNAPTKEFTVQIYNRWGKLIHERSSAESNRVGTGYQIWDGSNVKDGTYFYIVSGEYADGSVYKDSGTVTIMKGN